MTRALLAAALLVAAAPAHAFVRSVTDNGTPVYWSTSCTSLIPDTDVPSTLDLDTTVAVIDRSIANWQTPTLDAGCSYLVIQRAAPVAVEARLDHENVVKFRKANPTCMAKGDCWCRPADPSQNQAEMCYAPAAAAITTVFYTDTPGKSGDGAIVDADIELNNIDYTFVDEMAGTASCPGESKADLENTLTHEIGHFQGLDHTCWDHAVAVQPKDDMGNPVPDCNAVVTHQVPQAEYDQITQSTMFNFASPCETIKRTPKADDIRGICTIYPRGKDPNNCNGSGSCTIGSPRTSPTGILCLAVPLLLMGFAGSIQRFRARACSPRRRP